MFIPKSEDLIIKSLGSARIDSPILPLLSQPGLGFDYVDDDDRILLDDRVTATKAGDTQVAPPSLELAGPRAKIFFDPSKTRVGIVTCGGLCPGLNDVIRGLVIELFQRYGVTKIYGFKNGYQGFISKFNHPVIDLDPEIVSDINERGGTILGSSRGEQDSIEIVDCLERMSINILFVVGGDGTIRGGRDIAREVERRGGKVAVIGIPKTIDNDIMFVEPSFGFQTAVAEATTHIRAAHVEAKGSPNGIGLVKLMGRHSGFIACNASLAMADANFVLIPEVPLRMEGKKGFLEVLKRRMLRRGHAVIVVAEGTGQDLLGSNNDRDASGNVKFQDIGLFIKDKINTYFDSQEMEVNVKYFDPSYSIRSVPANPYDAVYCFSLAMAAVHAAMAGKTEMIIGHWHNRFVHLPITLATQQRQTVDPRGDLWLAVLESTNQPVSWE